MKKFAALLPVVLLTLSSLASAFDDDPGSLGDRRWSNDRSDHQDKGMRDPNMPLFYRPTQRYYGNGYTISYHYIPVYRSDGAYTVPAHGASNFPTEIYHIATEDIPGWRGNPPRLTLKDPKSAAPRSAVTSIVRKKTTTRTTTKTSETDTPVVLPEMKDPAAPSAAAPSAGSPSAGVPSAGSPSAGSSAPIPAPTEAPAKP